MSQCTTAAEKLTEEYGNWLRLITFIDNAGRTLCQNILHKKEKVPVDGKGFYSMLQNYKNRMHFQIHKEILGPLDQIIDESKFDLLLYMTVIHMIYDDRYEDVIQDLRSMRNQLFHMGKKSLSAEDFENLWSRVFNMFHKHGLKDDDIKPFIEIKNCKLSPAVESKGILKFLAFC